MSTPLFITSENEKVLRPLGDYATAESVKSYPAVTAREYYNSVMGPYFLK